MKKMLLGILIFSLVSPLALVAQQRVCGMEKISSLHLRVPVTVQMPAGLKLATADIDEKGNIYVSCSVWQETENRRIKNSPPYLIKYDPSGKIINMFTMPSLPEETQITSIAYRGGKVYVAAQQRGQKEKNGILVFDDSGKLDQLIKIDGVDAYKVRLSQAGDIYVLGIPRENLSNESQMIFRLSPGGDVITSFSPVTGRTREEINDSLRSIMHNELLLDESGRVFHILPDGEVRIFSPDGGLIKAFRSDGTGSVIAAFLDSGDLMITRADKGGSSSIFGVSSQQPEQPICETGSRALPLPPMFKGADGYYYGIGHLGVSRNTSVTQLEFILAKYKKVHSSVD